MNVRYKNLEKKLQVFKSVCREHGLKITPQRVAIYKEFISSQKHPSAVMIHKKIRNYYPNVSLDTVNRTLLTFNKINLAKIIEYSGDPKRFDPILEKHHHFRCISCGTIIDFYHDDYNAIGIPAEFKEKFFVLDKRVHLEGICEKCK
ncbi:MAG: transcriptional repressor [Deltaproteobacteria bacterium]|nr:transcriptional repressor [Deltaproteobacteria bacterium]